jgi:DNA-binding NarL/FixJ family response regulator
MTSDRRTVVIIDDHSLFRQGVRALIDDHVTVVGEGGTSEEARRLVAEHQPDVLLLDVEIPGVPAEQTILRVHRDNPDTSIIVLTMHSDSVLQRQLLRAGATQFVTKTVGQAALISIVLNAMPPKTVRRSQPEGVSNARTILTPRELEVLRLISQAYTNRDISEKARIAEGTVKRHTTNMYAKLGATSRIDAVRKAARLGLLD